MTGRLSERARALAGRVVGLRPMPQPPFRPTRHPVVLMHGFGAAASAAAGGLFHREAMFLRGHGVAAYAPQVNPYDTVAVRAASWADRLGRVLDETGAEKVNLVGFSAGGLDARFLTAEMGWADRVASVVTVATPHRGTPLADYVLSRPERLRAWAVGAMDWVGRAAYADAPPHTAEALAELTPAGVAARFGPETVPGVWCASFASRAGKGARAAVHPAFVVGNRVLYGLAGLNDGVVLTASAPWGELLGVLEADHARIAGVRVAPSRLFESRAFYLSVAERLRARGL